MIKTNYIWETIKIIYKGSPLRFCVCILLLVFISTLNPLYIIAANRLINTLTVTYQLNILIYPFVFFILTLILNNSKSFINLLGSYLWITAEVSLQRALIEKTSKKNLSFYDTPSFYNNLERAKQGYGNAVGTTMMVISAIFISVFSVLFTIAFLVQVSMGIAILLIFIVGIKIVSYIFETKNLQTLRTEQSSEIIKRNLLSEYIWSKESRVYGASAYFLNQWSEKNAEIIKKENKIKRKNLLFSFGMDSLMFFLYSMVLFSVVVLRMRNETAVIAEIIIMFIAMDSIFNNIGSIVLQFGNILQNAALSKDLFDYLNSEDQEPAFKAISGKYAISLKDVSFSYPLSKVRILKNINMKVHVGENIAIVGRNGSGKTTLFKLLSGLYSPSSGDITYANNLYLSEKTHKNISLMFQDAQAYNLTFAENIKIGDMERECEENTVKNILHDVFGQEWVSKYPKMEGTFIGKEFGGIELSGGEQQRLSLGRTLFRKSTVVFLDEPASALDALAEERLYKDFLEVSKGKTTFFVTHRLATVRYADRIIVIKHGEIVEQGTHQELISRNGEYFYLYNLQKQGFS